MIDRAWRHCLAPFVCALTLCLLVAVPVAANDEVLEFDEPVRVWSDSSGQFDVDATLIAYQKRVLTLQTPAGKAIEVSIDRLSKSDQSYTLKLLRRARAKTVDFKTPPIQKQVPSVDAAPEPSRTHGDVTLASKKLYGVNWHLLDQAESYAAVQNKPVMWFRVLGDMEGFM